MKAVALVSGGLDSTVMMYALIKDYEIWPLTISYGQLHAKEVDAARGVCCARTNELGTRWTHLDLSVLSGFLKCALTGCGTIPSGAYDTETIKTMVVPNRNMMFLAIAASYAWSIGADCVAYAAHHNDAAVYPDCRPEFVQSAAETISLGTEGRVVLLAPFIHFTKGEIVKLGKGLNVPFAKTWSCYKGGLIHCGTCPTCLDRRQAFKVSGIEDPTIYAQT